MDDIAVLDAVQINEDEHIVFACDLDSDEYLVGFKRGSSRSVTWHRVGERFDNASLAAALRRFASGNYPGLDVIADDYARRASKGPQQWARTRSYYCVALELSGGGLPIKSCDHRHSTKEQASKCLSRGPRSRRAQVVGVLTPEDALSRVSSFYGERVKRDWRDSNEQLSVIQRITDELDRARLSGNDARAAFIQEAYVALFADRASRLSGEREYEEARKKPPKAPRGGVSIFGPKKPKFTKRFK
jgi:hypothetical protein